MPGKPRTVVCYICGREFGTRSLDIHERQCIQKWHIENNKLPKHQRRPAPQKPQGLPALGGGGKQSQSIEAWNDAAYKSAQSQLLECENCGRTFGTDRLEVHQRSCTAANPQKPIKKIQQSNGRATPRPGSRPGTVTVDAPKVLKPSMIDVGSNPTPRTNRGAATSSHTKMVNGRPKTPATGSRPGTVTLSKRPMNGGQSSPPPKTPRRKPNFVVCYICGREFTMASLPIHEPQCLEKWKVENAKLPREMRRPVPKKPVVVPISGSKSGKYNADAINAAAYEAAQANLVPCDLCGRTFAQDRIQTHQRICTKVGGMKSAGKTRSSVDEAPQTSRPKMANPGTSSKPARQPKFVFCYICGRQFTDASLPIHEPQCLQKWEVENNKLPREMRKPRPKKPEALARGKTMTREEMQEMQYEASKGNLVACKNCGRTFNTDRIMTHQRICKDTGGKGPGTSGGGGGNQQSQQQSLPTPKTQVIRKPQTVVCYICGREFGSKSIGIHEPQCITKWRAENDKQPPNQRRPEPVKPQALQSDDGAEESKQPIGEVEESKQSTEEVTTEKKERRRKKKKGIELKVLDPRSAHNLSIVLGSVRASHVEIKRRIIELDEEHVTPELLDTLLKFMPGPEQMDALSRLKSEYDWMTEAEQFCIVMSSIKRLVPRLNSMVCKMRFQQKLVSIKHKIEVAIAALEEIQQSTKFAQLLVLSKPMHMDTHSANHDAPTDGLEISLLTEFKNTKTVDQKNALMRVLIATYKEKYQDQLYFKEELIHIEQASKVSAESFEQNLQLMCKSLQQLKTYLADAEGDITVEPEDQFAKVMSSFVIMAENELEVLYGMTSKMSSLFNDLAARFAFDPVKYRIDDLFSDLKTFCENFNMDSTEEGITES